MHDVIEACDELGAFCARLSWGRAFERSRLDLHRQVDRLCSADGERQSDTKLGVKTRVLASAEGKLKMLAAVETKKLGNRAGGESSEVTSTSVKELRQASRRVQDGSVDGEKDLDAAHLVLDASNLADVSPELQEGGTNVSDDAEKVVTVEDVRAITEATEGHHVDLQESLPDKEIDSEHIILQGDMRVPRKRASLLTQRQQLRGRQSPEYGDGPRWDDDQRKIAAGHSWPNATVTFCFARDISKKSKIAFLEGVEHYRKRGVCVTFSEIDAADDGKTCISKSSLYVQSSDKGMCWSDVGYFEDGAALNLGRGCEIKGIVVHEIGHTLGMDHEQARPDRDQYVKVVPENVMPGMEEQFANNPDAYTKEPYDYLSIMHYGTFTFSKDKQRRLPTVVSLDDKEIPGLGQAMGLSDMDVRQLLDMYCPSKKNATLPIEGADASPLPMQSVGYGQWQAVRWNLVLAVSFLLLLVNVS
jgi:hypothetical protein